MACADVPTARLTKALKQVGVFREFYEHTKKPLSGMR